MKNEKRKRNFIWFLAVIPLILTIFLYRYLPQKVPMHWNINGEIDNMANKFPGAFILPILILAMMLLMTLLPKVDPKSKNYALFKKSYYWLQLCLVFVLDSMSILILLVSLGYDSIKVDVVVKFLIGILIMVIGNFMPKLKQNYFTGIKTPWTLANEEVWFATHRLAGVIWFISGMIMIILSFVPGLLSALLYFSIIAFAAFVPLLYSYFAYKKHIE